MSVDAAHGQRATTADTQQQPALASSNLGRSTFKSRLSVCTASSDPAADASTWGLPPRASSAAPADAAAAEDSTQLKTCLTAAEMLAVGRIQPAATASTKASLGDRVEVVASPHSGSDTVTAADEAVQDNFSKLLTGRMTRSRASSVINSPTAAVVGPTSQRPASPGADGAAAAVTLAPSSATAAAAGPRSSMMGTTGRISLANIGLLAAPGAGLLPGSLIEASGPLAAAADHPAAGKAVVGRQSVYQQYTPAAVGPTPAAAAVARHSSAPLDARVVAMQQKILELQQQASTSSAGHKPHQSYDTPRSATSSAETDRSSSPQRGSAAFRTTTRQQADRVGRVHIEADSPGPAHYRPTQEAMQKHVPSTHIAGHSSSSTSRPSSPKRPAAAVETAAADEIVHQPQQSVRNTRASMADAQEMRRTSVVSAVLQAPGPNIGVFVHQAATPAAVAAAAARGSATDLTPRLDDPGQAGPLGLTGHRVHARQKATKGSASFMTVTREQRERQGKFGRPASAAADTGRSSAGAGSSSGGGKLSTAGQTASSNAAYSSADAGHATRPRSSKGVPFSKQTPRPASPAGVGHLPPTLGPGSYHQSGQLPISNTGADVPAGHPDSSLERSPDFTKYTMRPGSSPAAIGGSRGSGGNAQPRSAGDWPGLWGWAAAAEGCVHQSSQPAAYSGTGQQQEGPGVQRPSSHAALSYARTQLGADLLSEQQQGSQDPGIATQGTIDLLQRQQQQTRPVSVAGRHQQRLKSASRARPASAGPVLGGTAATRASSLLEAYGYPAAGQRPGTSPNSSSAKGGVLGLQELQMFSSTGLAPRVKGGAFSTGSRAAASKVLRAMSVGSVIPPASVAVLQPGTELSYEPNPEVQGHMHRSPGWSLPPNRLATSRKWAQLAQQAALQP